MSRWRVRRHSGSGTRSPVSGDGNILIELQLRGPVEGSKDFAIVYATHSHLRGFCSRPHLFWDPEVGPGFQVPLALEGCFTRAPAQLPLIWFIAFHSISRSITLLMWWARGPRRGRRSSCASLSPPDESWGWSPRSPMHPGERGASAAGPGISIALSVHRGPSARRGGCPHCGPPAARWNRHPSARAPARPTPSQSAAGTSLTSLGDPEELRRRGPPFSGSHAARADLRGSRPPGGSDATAPGQRHQVCARRSRGHQGLRPWARAAPSHPFTGPAPRGPVLSLPRLSRHSEHPHQGPGRSATALSRQSGSSGHFSIQAAARDRGPAQPPLTSAGPQ
ncbi:hypothetical protein NDU88_005780 [Pleurodeles waltl]|uniref:Uncharacterized protein n=1 Tax=Pleurodeles waltl TaxID=8319 RepID=A0AAV7LM67_PLEWA|nr:hypothetical protein NDU88_005780 [Pleurodeles waltl]